MKLITSHLRIGNRGEGAAEHTVRWCGLQLSAAPLAAKPAVMARCRISTARRLSRSRVGKRKLQPVQSSWGVENRVSEDPAAQVVNVCEHQCQGRHDAGALAKHGRRLGEAWKPAVHAGNGLTSSECSRLARAGAVIAAAVKCALSFSSLAALARASGKRPIAACSMLQLQLLWLSLQSSAEAVDGVPEFAKDAEFSEWQHLVIEALQGLGRVAVDQPSRRAMSLA